MSEPSNRDVEATRRQRLAQALRDNLKRRKEQKRGQENVSGAQTGAARGAAERSD